MKRHFAVALALGLAVAAFPALQELRVEEAVVCRAVVDRTPQDAGETFPADAGQLYCFSRIVGGSEGTTVTHVWKMGETPLFFRNRHAD